MTSSFFFAYDLGKWVLCNALEFFARVPHVKDTIKLTLVFSWLKNYFSNISALYAYLKCLIYKCSFIVKYELD